MTSSKLTVSRSSRVLVAIAVLLLTTGVAAAGRKRVAVLDFEGADAEKVQKGVVALIKKSHTVVTQDKWDDAASDLGASSLSEKNIKKVAKKLKLDGVISGEVEKRRGEYIIRIKLRAGTTGEFVGKGVNVKSSSSRLDSSSQDDLQAELVGEITGLDQNRGTVKDDDEDEEEEARPSKKKPAKKVDEDEDEEDEEEEAPKKPAKKVAKKDEDEDEEDEDEGMSDRKPKKGFSKKASAPKQDEDEDEDEDDPLPKKRPAKSDDEDEDEKETASTDEDEDDDEPSISKSDEDEDDDDEGSSLSSKEALAPGERAVDAVAGLSITMRRLGFKFGAAATVPNGYKGAPVPGLMIDATIYPGAMSHKKGGIAENIGATILVDKVLIVSSQDLMGNKLASSQLRWEVGAIARYPMKSATIGASFKYGRQSFAITGDSPVPDVAYSYINPSAFVRIPATPKILVNVAAGVLGVMATGEIQEAAQYGGASVLGIDFEGSADYTVKPNLFVRAALNVQTFAFTFKGNGMRSMDVAGARDSYFSLGVNLGYLY
jgi:hypothetical protein